MPTHRPNRDSLSRLRERRKATPKNQHRRFGVPVTNSSCSGSLLRYRLLRRCPARASQRSVSTIFSSHPPLQYHLMYPAVVSVLSTMDKPCPQCPIILKGTLLYPGLGISGTRNANVDFLFFLNHSEGNWTPMECVAGSRTSRVGAPGRRGQATVPATSSQL